MKSWFTSDLHFGHSKLLEYCPSTRPWKTADEMDEALILHWNSQVAEEDSVYFLGDMFFHKSERIGEILATLNGKIHLVKGNHDSALKVHYHRFESVSQILETKINKQSVVMCHFPMLQWNKMQYGSFHLYGHVHGRPLPEMKGRSMDVGWDAHGKLLCWEDIFDNLKYKPILEH